MKKLNHTVKKTICAHSIVCMLYASVVQAQLFPSAEKDSLQYYISYLGNDSMQGRATGSTSLEKAAAFIAAKLESNKLQPMGNNNSWFQKIPMYGSKVLPASAIQIYHDNTNNYLFYGDDFLLIKPGAETFIPALLPVVFVGYGISAPEYEYDDYNNIDVTGKIVVFMDGEPPSSDLEYFKASKSTIYAIPESKIRTAISKGAAGSILIDDLSFSDSLKWTKKRIEYSFEDVSLPKRVTAHLAVILNPHNANMLLAGSGKTYEELLKGKEKNTLSSFPLKTKVAFNGFFKQREFKSDNILGSVVGRDSILNKEYLLIGAHYDHLGIGMKLNGDSIYNGVLDNAVGTAIVLELARMFSQASFKPKRSIILAFFSGEEKGLLGSSYYTEHPPVAIKNTVAMLNVDGVSALGYFHSLIAVGGEYSELGLTLQSVAGEYGLEIEQVSAIDSENPFSKSDQLSFAQSGVPAIQVLEGYSYSEMSAEQAILKTRKWFNNIYHSPFDDLNQPIEYAAIERFTNILFAFCNRILNQDNIPQWYQSSPYQRKQ